MLTYYELDLGLNHVVRKYSEGLEDRANFLINGLMLLQLACCYSMCIISLSCCRQALQCCVSPTLCCKQWWTLSVKLAVAKLS